MIEEMNQMRLTVFSMGLLCLNLAGCMVWPVMTETNGYRPIEMGKQDQVWYWNAPQPTVLSSDFGQSLRQARSNQILFPNASENLEIVEGLNGRAGVNAIARYQSLFKKPPYSGQVSAGEKK